MDGRKPTLFTYKGESLIIIPGSYLRKEDIIMRLKEMNFLSVDLPYNKSDLNNLYDIAIRYDENKLKIVNRLKKDTQLLNSKRKFPINLSNRENQNIPMNPNTKKSFCPEENRRDNRFINNNNNDEDNLSELSPPNESSSFCTKVLKFIYNHKMDIIEKLFLIFIIYNIDSYIKKFSENHFILGRLLMRIRNIITPKRIIFAFLIYYVLKYILNMFFYYLFGFGILTIVFLLCRDKLNDFLFNV